MLRRRAEVPESAPVIGLSREEFVRAYGADPGDVDLVTETVSSLGLRVLEVDRAVPAGPGVRHRRRGEQDLRDVAGVGHHPEYRRDGVA